MLLANRFRVEADGAPVKDELARMMQLVHRDLLAAPDATEGEFFAVHTFGYHRVQGREATFPSGFAAGDLSYDHPGRRWDGLRVAELVVGIRARGLVHTMDATTSH